MDQLVASQDLALVQAVSELDLTAAIQELDKSTEEIRKQAEALQQHQNALDKLVAGISNASKARSELEVRRSVKQASARAQTLTLVRQLGHS